MKIFIFILLLYSFSDTWVSWEEAIKLDCNNPPTAKSLDHCQETTPNQCVYYPEANCLGLFLRFDSLGNPSYFEVIEENIVYLANLPDPTITSKDIKKDVAMDDWGEEGQIMSTDGNQAVWIDVPSGVLVPIPDDDSSLIHWLVYLMALYLFGSGTVKNRGKIMDMIRAVISKVKK